MSPALHFLTQPQHDAMRPRPDDASAHTEFLNQRPRPFAAAAGTGVSMYDGPVHFTQRTEDLHEIVVGRGRSIHASGQVAVLVG